MKTVDSSVVVAAFASWHQDHALAARAIAQKPDLPTAVALESFSVLTRLPPPHRAQASIVRDFLVRSFPGPWLALPPDGWVRVIHDLVARGVSGGASYDAVIALTAMYHERELLTLDRRAQRTYGVIGAVVRFLD